MKRASLFALLLIAALHASDSENSFVHISSDNESQKSFVLLGSSHSSVRAQASPDSQSLDNSDSSMEKHYSSCQGSEDEDNFGIKPQKPRSFASVVGQEPKENEFYIEFKDGPFRNIISEIYFKGGSSNYELSETQKEPKYYSFFCIPLLCIKKPVEAKPAYYDDALNLYKKIEEVVSKNSGTLSPGKANAEHVIGLNLNMPWSEQEGFAFIQNDLAFFEKYIKETGTLEPEFQPAVEQEEIGVRSSTKNSDSSSNSKEHME
ncbi:MAG: hypothetical protein AB7R69_03110 [Candidatus Babeliales bacterium]